MNLTWLPNAISELRLFFVIPYALFLYGGNNSAAIIIALIILLSDAVDGWFARKLRIESKFGEFLDGFADGTFIIITWIILFLQNQYGLALLINLVVPRLLIGLSILIYRIKRSSWNFEHQLSNKIGGAFYFLSILWILLGLPYVTIILWTTVIVNYISFILSTVDRFKK